MAVNQIRFSSLLSPISLVLHSNYNQTGILFPEFAFFLSQSQAFLCPVNISQQTGKIQYLSIDSQQF
jgi:hypothetical protein